MNSILCSQCESKLDSGKLTKADGKFPAKIWLVEEGASDTKFIEDLFFPIKILAINRVWAPGGIQKSKVIVSGKRTPRFPIDIERVVSIAKDLRRIELAIEFERK